MLLGILYCKGTVYEKSKCFYEVVQNNLNEKISANDKDFQALYPNLLNLTTICMFHFTAVKLQKPISEIDEAKEATKMEDIFFEILTELTEQIFGVNSSVSREEFIGKVCGEC